MYVYMYMYICIYMYVCPDPIRCSDPIRSRWLVPKLRSYKAEQLFGIQPTSRFEGKKKGSSKAPLFPPTILTTIGNLSNRCNYLFDTQDHPRSSLRSLHQPSRCFLVYLDSSSLPPILSFNLFPVALPIGSVFLLG